MEVQLAVLADAANVAAPGRLNFLGIFNAILVRDFPTEHPRIVLALRLQLEFEDANAGHELEVVLLNEDGRQFIHGKAQVRVPRIGPGDVSFFNHVLSFEKLAFGRPGRYSFHIRWNGAERARIALTVAAVSPGT